MTDKKDHTKAEAAELSEEDLENAQGGAGVKGSAPKINKQKPGQTILTTNENILTTNENITE